MKTLEDKNELIARFMGMTYGYSVIYNQNVFESSGGLMDKILPPFRGYYINELLFHEDWNWLMLVIEKMTRVSVDWNKGGEHFFKNVKDKLLTLSIEKTHDAVVEMIEWYNEQN